MRFAVAAAVAAVIGIAGAAPASAQNCADNSNALGVSRVVEIDTTGGPGFGFEHYKAHDFLEKGEVVLTFDDGPWPSTREVLSALAAHCTRATFFTIGKHATYYPEILKEVAAAGHTIGTHTWSHKGLYKMTFEKAREEIEMGVSAVKRSAGGPISPFFRYPELRDTEQTIEHLGKRNVAIFSTDIDSFDFKIRSTDALVKSLIAKLEKRGKGIVLLHDFQPGTGKALPKLLTELKAKGFKIVHMKAKDPVATLPEFDELVAKEFKGPTGPGADKPTSSVVRTITNK